MNIPGEPKANEYLLPGGDEIAEWSKAPMIAGSNSQNIQNFFCYCGHFRGRVRNDCIGLVNKCITSDPL